ncbi:DUF6218 family protein [Actinoplanes sp. NBRC 103695]|uniref:DUF6218 family protein n=1 Tax=Actinoplanes sp. NBRC 103695 TaxID=3032202 RepID=UPI0024A5FB21|nr:DUF6218 family protein [Actinoplanes sp. NBRC 103695]GLY95510.1 hypothetical protein Acsp02_27650 [Actinoplanes sp. NBRC 103695]
MTSTFEADNTPSMHVDYVPGARGHCVLAIGADQHGRKSVAVWQLGPTGDSGGAWVINFTDLDQQKGDLQKVVANQCGRCLVGWDSDGPAAVVDRLALYLSPRVVRDLAGSIVVIPDLLEEITEHRERYAAAVNAYRTTTKSKIVPLSWGQDMPGDLASAQRALTPRYGGSGSPVAADALGIAVSLKRAVRLWHDTEQARFSRSYLRSFGEPRALPPRWLGRLRAATNRSAA